MLRNRIPRNHVGIFPAFSQLMTRNNALLEKTVYKIGGYHHSECWVQQFDVPDFLNAPAFSVYDLFCLVLELADLLYHFQMQNRLLLKCYLSFRQPRNNLLDCLLSIHKKCALDSLKRRFPIIEQYALQSEEPNQFTLERRGQRKINIPAPLVQTENGDLYLLTSTSDSNNISDVNMHFILMLFLGHTARYKAPLLKEIMEGQERSEYLALIEKFVEVSERKFPKLILDELLGQYLRFSEH